jgi:DNA-binding transcriptional MerR regulator
MQIGTVAKKVGFSVDAIRFYERNALLPWAPRSEGGFRQYGEGEIDTLGSIRRAQGLGFTLGEVRELLALRQSRLQPCAPMRQRLEQKLVQVHRKLTDLQKLERELRLALRSCNRGLHKRSVQCPLLGDKSQLKPESSK